MSPTTSSAEVGVPGVGRIAIVASAAGLVRVDILVPAAAATPRTGSGAAAAVRDRALAELEAWRHGGELTCPVVLDGLPPFVRRVLVLLRRVRRGETIAYGQLAERAGSPGAARAVGTACHRNPVPLWVPCHRVLAANGLGGFGSGDGTATKRALLAIEGVDGSRFR